MRQFNIGKATANSIGNRFQRRLHQSDPDPSNVEEEDIHDTQNGRCEPNGEEGDEREGNTPHEGQWQGKDGR